MQQENYKIYLYINKNNNKIYIGQTKNTLIQRAGLHGQKYKGCRHFFRAIQKDGWENFTVKILEENLSYEEAQIREKYWIKFFNAKDKNKGYNLTDGGDKLEGINRSGRSKKVICKETGQEFPSLTAAAEWAGLSKTGGTNIGQVACGKRTYAGTHPDTGEPLHWYFPDNQIETKERHTKAQKVKNLNTGIIYDSLSAAIKETGFSYQSIIKSYKSNGTIGVTKNHQKYYFVYVT